MKLLLGNVKLHQPLLYVDDLAQLLADELLERAAHAPPRCLEAPVPFDVHVVTSVL